MSSLTAAVAPGRLRWWRRVEPARSDPASELESRGDGENRGWPRKAPPEAPRPKCERIRDLQLSERNPLGFRHFRRVCHNMWGYSGKLPQEMVGSIRILPPIFKLPILRGLGRRPAGSQGALGRVRALPGPSGVTAGMPCRAFKPPIGLRIRGRRRGRSPSCDRGSSTSPDGPARSRNPTPSGAGTRASACARRGRSDRTIRSPPPPPPATRG